MFRDNLRTLMAAKNYTAKDLAQKIEAHIGKTDKKLYRIVENWIGKRSSIPRADVAVSIARALGTTVEYLVEGGEGTSYIQSIVEKDGILYRPPERIAAMVRVLSGLDDEKLATIRPMVMALSGEEESLKETTG